MLSKSSLVLTNVKFNLKILLEERSNHIYVLEIINTELSLKF